MDEKTILITERNGTYQLQNNGISEFALIGILECIVFDLKSANRQTADSEQKEPLAESGKTTNLQPEEQSDSAPPLPESKETKETETIENSKETAPVEPKREVTEPTTAVPDLRTRIGNAVKAIRALGAQIEDTDLNNLTEEELQSELEELTSQYKRLKSSKATGK